MYVLKLLMIVRRQKQTHHVADVRNLLMPILAYSLTSASPKLISPWSGLGWFYLYTKNRVCVPIAYEALIITLSQR